MIPSAYKKRAARLKAENPGERQQSTIGGYFKRLRPQTADLDVLQDGEATKEGENGECHSNNVSEMQIESSDGEGHMDVDEKGLSRDKYTSGTGLLDKYKNCNRNSIQDGEINEENERAFAEKFSLNQIPNGGVQKFDHTQKTIPSNSQLTQLEKQYLKIKSDYKDCLLLTEVGYKYRFFGDDALVAAKELNIVAYIDHAMYTASIPTHRLNVHVHRLVQSGYKVGIVQQTETAALKAAGSNKLGPFERKLTKIYTRGTFIEDLGSSSTQESNKSGGTGYILYMVETGFSKKSSTISLVSVSPSIGHIIYDEFEVSDSYSSLQIRLSHIMPVEIVVSEKRVTKRVLDYIKAQFSVSPIDGLPVRIEIDNSVYDLDLNQARDYVVNEYRSIMEDKDDEKHSLKRKLSFLDDLPGGVMLCISALLKYLSKFGLSRVAVLPEEYTSFLSLNSMTFNSDTLDSLDLYDTASHTQKAGSLVSILDRTCTPMGKRTLRKWLLSPLVIKHKIQERQDAVEEMIEKYNFPEVVNLMNVFRSLPDIEKSICRIFYHRCRPSDLYATLSSLKSLSTETPVNFFSSKLLRETADKLLILKTIIPDLIDSINPQIASKNETIDVLVDTRPYPEISKCKKDLENTYRLMDEHLLEIAKHTKSKPSYTTVAGTSHLIEIPLSQASKVPPNWIKINQTKSVARFHTPFITEKLRTLGIYQELLQASSDDAYKRFLKFVSGSTTIFKEASDAVGVLDCIISLSISAISLNYTRPEISDDLEVRASKCRNPIVEHSVDTYTPNNIDISANNRVLLITGPNMGGKSCYIKQVALLVIMAQMGSFVSAEYARVGIFTSILTRMGADDDITKGQSTFMKELTETNNIIKSATERSLVIIDELGRGTSTYDGTAIAHSTLTYFIKEARCVTLFISHFTSLGELRDLFPDALHCYHMGFIENKSEEDADAIVFLYKVADGMAQNSYGLNVARLAGLPPEIVKRAKGLSSDMQIATEKRIRGARLQKKVKFAERFLSSGSFPDPSAVLHIACELR